MLATKHPIITHTGVLSYIEEGMYLDVDRSVHGRLVDSSEPDLKPDFGRKFLESGKLRVSFPQSFACSPVLKVLRCWSFRHSCLMRQRVDTGV